MVRLRLKPLRQRTKSFIGHTYFARFVRGSSFDVPLTFISAWRQCLSDESLGQYWAAIRQGKAVKLVSMSVPTDIDKNQYNDYASKQRDALNALGELRSGELIQRDEKFLFVQRLSHKNRSKSQTPRAPKEFEIHPQALKALFPTWPFSS